MPKYTIDDSKGRGNHIFSPHILFTIFIYLFHFFQGKMENDGVLCGSKSVWAIKRVSIMK